MKKIKTMNVSGGEYAKVKDRLLEFRKENPRGLIDTSYEIVMSDDQSGGYIIFKARIIRDKKDEHSAEATGHSMGKGTGAKVFEKQESIAVGRALALLGYGADGEIASAEEMEEFEDWKQQQFMESLDDATDTLKACKNADELKKVWVDLSPELKTALEGLKDEMKKSYENNTVSE